MSGFDNADPEDIGEVTAIEFTMKLRIEL